MSALPVVASARSAVVSGSSSSSLLSSTSTWSQTLSRMTSSRRHRYPRLRLSPSRVLALRLRSKTDRQKKAYGSAFEFAAKQRTDRLPLLLFQAWMARQDLHNEHRVSTPIRSITPSEWADRFRSLASRGWSTGDMDHWIWILSGEDGDVRIQRLVSTETPKPIFLVTILVRSDERLGNAESLLSLMKYTSRHYFHSPTPSSGNDVALPGRKVTMTSAQFLLLLRRIVRHVQRFWPRSITTVARFTADYIRGMPSDATGYHQKCEVFNAALQLFKQPAATQPIQNMEFNWRAQRLLLAMSDNLDKPLIINKASYRAIREVMIGLKRSQTERAVAIRYAKSWPPYRQDFDGLDAKRTAEDDYSRSVKAGIVMKEAGYPDDNYDQALDALGGMSNNSPTIQTRSLPPKEWKGEEQDRNVYTRWAMMIRATRNQQEAWKVFNDLAAETGKPPNVQVYAEIFIKLQAHPLPPTSTALPGESRENFPIHDANYSEYELARLSPPTVTELYDHMIASGVKPHGHCLHTLLINAGSLEEGIRYLQDSGINMASIRSLTLFKEPSFQALRQIPLLVFKSYIQLLCRLQPDRRGRERIPLEELHLIRHAIKLVKLRLRPDTTEGSTFRPPWSVILRALARSKICVLNGTSASNDAEALSMALDVIQSVRRTAGVDPEIFLYLCRSVQKTAVSQLDRWEASIGDSSAAEISSLVPSAETISDTLKALFSDMTIPVKLAGATPSTLPAPKFMHDIGPAHLHGYMRALAFLEDTTAMEQLLEWMLANKTYIDEETERIGSRGHALIAKTLCAFQAFVGPSLEQEQQDDIINRVENTGDDADSWKWPTPEEVDHYVQSDLRGGSRKLQQRLLAKFWLLSSHQDNVKTPAMIPT
ncbi:hypothetical protein F5Y04DRAFT_81994 [Hypomontagnella monticulosa]|nr:hypothetical protein F5Y04DRAFT_81994 [Hypomontagnella monticulosa]